METELWGCVSFEQLTAFLRAAERQLGVCSKQYVLERFARRYADCFLLAKSYGGWCFQPKPREPSGCCHQYCSY